MKKILAITILGLCIISLVGLVDYNYDNNDNGGNQVEEDERVFHGPVPEGYDEEHFRRTGETVPLG